MENGNTAAQADGNVALYTARRSVWAYGKRIWISVAVSLISLAVGIFCLVRGEIFGLLGFIIPLVGAAVLIFTFIEAGRYKILFYPNKIIVKSGLLSTSEAQSVMTPIIGVSVAQSVGGKIFNYGNVIIDKTGRGWDISTSYIKNPHRLKAFLQSLIDATDYGKINMHISN